MKHETSNLLIGLGIGAVVGVAVGYLMVADNRKKLAEEFDHAVSKVKEEVIWKRCSIRTEGGLFKSKKQGRERERTRDRGCQSCS